jgi:thiamine transport system ATP-binding protein
VFEIDAVGFAYKGQTEPYEFSLSVSPGEILGISGASGSGKSTLLDLISGFLTPSSGTIMLAGVGLTDLPPEQRPVAILFQSDNLFDHLSVAKNLALARPKARLAEAELDASLDAVGLGGLSRRRAADLSGGQKQRVALARCLLLDRPILLLDEPFSALDEATAESTRTLVRTLVTQHNWHTLLVSHLEQDLAIADRRLDLVDGRLRLPKNDR